VTSRPRAGAFIHGQRPWLSAAGVIQFLYSPAEEGLLRFDHDAARWSWNLDRIHAKGYTGNVVDRSEQSMSKSPVTEEERLPSRWVPTRAMAVKISLYYALLSAIWIFCTG
jgi:hypothetical protein